MTHMYMYNVVHFSKLPTWAHVSFPPGVPLNEKYLWRWLSHQVFFVFPGSGVVVAVVVGGSLVA